MNPIRKIWLAVASAVTLTLSACGGGGGGGGGSASSSGSVPDSAGASAESFIDFNLALGTSDETSEPLSISDSFAVPPDETSEPRPLSSGRK
jgi:hypothetical protein